jgi:nuclease S1
MNKRGFVLLLALVLSSAPLGAWGRQGHRIVARVAAKNLTPDARKKVAAILGTTTTGVEGAMAEASTWPDEIDKKSTGTEAWHFIDVPVTAPFSVAGLCANHACVIDQIENMRDRLKMNSTGFKLKQPPDPRRRMTLQELSFLIHLVGDIHQPLHAATNGDRGGNCVPLLHPLAHGGSETKELHAAWDVDEVSAVLAKLGSESATATTLFQRFKNGAQVPDGTIVDWARESNVLARSDIYQKLMIASHTAPPGACATGIAKVDITNVYLDGNAADVERQLMRAGIRLSNLLNEMCAGDGCQAKPGAH